MKFRTSVILTPLPEPHKIQLSDKIFLMGSCFSENIGNKLYQNKFNILINPFGVIFNPFSIVQLLNGLIETENGQNLEKQLQDFYLQHDEVWYNYHLHSKIAALEKSELEHLIKSKAQETYQFLKETNVVILTFGTAFLYELIEQNTPISNCHKQPKALFNKKLIDLEDTRKKIASFIENISHFGTQKRIILTVSPVRHLKEGLVENSFSKSLLKVLTYQITEQFENVFYFPSYEIVLDDLRDYRFYEKDLLHPNAQAIDYIWNQFYENYLSKKAKEFLKKWQKIQAALNHQPFFPQKNSHQKFLKKLNHQIMELEKEFGIKLRTSNGEKN